MALTVPGAVTWNSNPSSQFPPTLAAPPRVPITFVVAPRLHPAWHGFGAAVAGAANMVTRPALSNATLASRAPAFLNLPFISFLPNPVVPVGAVRENLREPFPGAWTLRRVR